MMTGLREPAFDEDGVIGRVKAARRLLCDDALSLALARDAEGLSLILRNRDSQLIAMAHKHRDKETALLRVMDAVTLAEAKRIAREAIQP